MPWKPRRACATQGCPELAPPTGPRYCSQHLREVRRAAEAKRPSKQERGYTSKWVAYAKWYLSMNPWCRMHEAEGKQVRATVVDHIIPHKGDPELMWNQDNHQGLCKRHHDQKTAMEAGTFGRNRQEDEDEDEGDEPVYI